MTSFHHIVVQTGVSGLITAAINGLTTAVMVHGRQTVSVIGGGGIALDIALSTFLGALMSAAVPAWLTLRRLRAGALASKVNGRERMPRNFLVRALLLALACSASAYGISTLVCRIGASTQISAPSYVVFKALYGFVIALAATPLAVLQTLALRIGK